MRPQHMSLVEAMHRRGNTFVEFFCGADGCDLKVHATCVHLPAPVEPIADEDTQPHRRAK